MILDAESQTTAAAARGRERLAELARGATDERHMAALARTAIFEEALLGALRSRFNELRSVAK